MGLLCVFRMWPRSRKCVVAEIAGSALPAALHRLLLARYPTGQARQHISVKYPLADAEDGLEIVGGLSTKLRNLLIAIFLLSFGLSLPLVPLQGAFVPFAVMEYTNTTEMLLGPVPANASAASPSSADNAPPVSRQWIDLCVGLHDVLCIAVAWIMFYATFMLSSRAVLRLLWRQCLMKLLATIGTALTYAATAATLLPNPHHALWLMLRTTTVVYLCHMDAFNAGFKLRCTPEGFALMIGSAERGRGWFKLIMTGIGGSAFLVVDVFRHLLVHNASPLRSIVDFGLVNPITGNDLTWSNHQFSEACYFTSMILCGQVFYARAIKHAGASGTTLLTTNFVLFNPEEARNAAEARRLIKLSQWGSVEGAQRGGNDVRRGEDEHAPTPASPQS